MAQLHKGVVARCSKGMYGVITVDHPRSTKYPDGSKAIAWIGVNIETGNIWTSRNPTYIASGIEVLDYYHRYKDLSK